MVSENKTKQGLHVKNRHRGLYDFDQLAKAVPQLAPLIKRNPRGQKTIDFSDPKSVKLLNKALLNVHYNIANWDIPQGYLCPPIPGRADYVHRLADLLVTDMPRLKSHRCRVIDIGTGANCIYPLIGAAEYNWSVVGTDIADAALNNARRIVQENPRFKQQLSFRLQHNSKSIFTNVIQENDLFDLSMCNPPFHRSQHDASVGSDRKVRNLTKQRKNRQGLDAQCQGYHDTNRSAKNATKSPLATSGAALNFGGQSAELWCEGGELAFITLMGNESKIFAHQVLWFSTLISKNTNIRPMKQLLEKLGVSDIHVEEMQQGQKVSRFIAWTFQNSEQRKSWLMSKC
jgi:23S rRNA (adenine1618-N6)-methyltransferase